MIRLPGQRECYRRYCAANTNGLKTSPREANEFPSQSKSNWRHEYASRSGLRRLLNCDCTVRTPRAPGKSLSQSHKLTDLAKFFLERFACELCRIFLFHSPGNFNLYLCKTSSKYLLSRRGRAGSGDPLLRQKH